MSSPPALHAAAVLLAVTAALAACKDRPGSGDGATAPTAAPSAPASAAAPANKAPPLVDVANLANGGFLPGRQSLPDEWAMLVDGIEDTVDFQPLFPAGSTRNEVVVSLAAPARIERFEVVTPSSFGEPPQRIGIAVAVPGTPTQFEPAAEIDVPANAGRGAVLAVASTHNGPVTAIRLTLDGNRDDRDQPTSNALHKFRAFGHFTKPPESGTVSGTWWIEGDGFSPGSNGTLLSLHQQGGQVQGCYYSGDEGKPLEVQTLLGRVAGGLDGNVLRFTRTATARDEDNKPRPGFFTVGSDGKAYAVVFSGTPTSLSNIAKGPARRVSTQSSDCGDKPGQAERPESSPLAQALEKTGRVQLYGVNFDFDSATLRPESDKVLQEVAALAKASGAPKLRIAGHTDNAGAEGYNQKLSESRAAAVVQRLVALGVPQEQLQSAGFGATQPIAPNESEAGKAQNRRVELVRQ